MNKLTKYGKWAVVTGGSAGIDREFAEQIAQAGINVILVARRREPLAVAATELRARYRVEVETVSADLSTEDGIAEVLRVADEREAGLAVINAGVGYGGDFVRRELDDYLREVRVNVEGLVRMLHHFARGFAERRRGGIVLTSSMGGYFSAPYLAHYVATKAYQLSLGEALSKELAAYGVDLTVLVPPATDTHMGKHGVPGIDAGKLPMLWSDPAKVARAGLNALGRRCYPGSSTASCSSPSPACSRGGCRWRSGRSSWAGPPPRTWPRRTAARPRRTPNPPSPRNPFTPNPTRRPDMNRTVLFSRFGGPEVLEVVDTPVRTPGHGEVRFRVKALGLNRAEVMYYRRNAYTEQAVFPSRIGYEAAGTVEAVGDGVVGLRVGDRVSTIPGFQLNDYGVAGDTAVVPQKHVVKISDSLSFAEGAAVWMQYLTAYGALVEHGKLKAGDVVAVTAASSSTGIAAIQMVNDAGGTSVAVTRKADKKAGLLKAGANHVIVTDDENPVERVNAITGGRGVDVVFDPVSGPMLATAGDIVREEGLVIQYGLLSSEPPQFPLWSSIVKGYRVQGFHLTFHVVNKPDRLTAGVEYVSERLASGAFKPLLAEKKFTLPGIADAYRYMESNEQLGKIIVAV
ncbi:MAG: SDR family NAD(P)-dependent oxidoreductase [Gemmataceae bacterium]|nr:SDR family NAD(P)-dependent oxidoreductase [Gemmataceae bacterium]